MLRREEAETGVKRSGERRVRKRRRRRREEEERMVNGAFVKEAVCVVEGGDMVVGCVCEENREW